MINGILFVLVILLVFVSFFLVIAFINSGRRNKIFYENIERQLYNNIDEILKIKLEILELRETSLKLREGFK